MKSINKLLVGFFLLSFAQPLQAADEPKDKSVLDVVDKKTMISFALSGLATGAGIGLVVSAFVTMRNAVMKRANTQIGVLKINDLSSMDSYIKELHIYAKDSTIKAILLMINCSEGSISIANTLYNELLTIKKTKPVIALIENQCSAAGYYVALASDQIVASPLAQISALNVQYSHSYFKNPQRIVIDKKHQCLIYGDAQEEVINVNQVPCVTSINCALTDQERRAMQLYVKACYEQFCSDVVVARKISAEEVYGYSQVPLFTGTQAYNLKLIDKVGTFSDTKDVIRKLLKQRRIRMAGSMVFIYPKESMFPFGLFESVPKPVFDIMARMFHGAKST